MFAQAPSNDPWSARDPLPSLRLIQYCEHMRLLSSWKERHLLTLIHQTVICRNVGLVTRQWTTVGVHQPRCAVATVMSQNRMLVVKALAGL